MGTIVIDCGITKITQGERELRLHTRRAHLCYNALIEIYNEDRRKYREIRRSVIPGLEEKEGEYFRNEDEIEDILKEVRKRRQKTSVKSKDPKVIQPTRSPLEPEEKMKLKEIRSRNAVLREEIRELRKQFDGILKEPYRQYDLRTTGVPESLLNKIEDVKKRKSKASREKDYDLRDELGEELKALKEKKKKISPATHKKREANKRVLSEMLKENWPSCWKDVMVLRDETRALVEGCLEGYKKSFVPEDIEDNKEEILGIQHGTYSAVIDAVDAAIKDTPETSFKRLYLKFSRWKGGKKVGTQLPTIKRKGLPKKYVTWGNLLKGCSNRIQVTDITPTFGRRDGNGPKKKEGSKTSRNKRLAKFMINIGRGDSPIWVGGNLVIHRQIPDNAEVTWVYIVPKRVGLRTFYRLQFTINVDGPLIKRSKGTGKAFIRFGWSKAGQGDEGHFPLLVAKINEVQENILLPPQIMSAFYRARDLKSKNDKHFQNTDGDGARDQLKVWMKEHKNLVPEWMPEMTKDIHAWRSHVKLALVSLRWEKDYPEMKEALEDPDRSKRLFRQWRKHRDKIRARTGDKEKGDYFTRNRKEVFDWLKHQGIKDGAKCMMIWLLFWRIKDAHMIKMHSEISAKACLRRKHYYCNVAVELRRKYGTVEIPRINLGEIERNTPTEKEEEEGYYPDAKYHKKCAAVYELKDAIKNIFGEDFKEVSEKSGADKKPGGTRPRKKKAKKRVSNKAA